MEEKKGKMAKFVEKVRNFLSSPKKKVEDNKLHEKFLHFTRNPDGDPHLATLTSLKKKASPAERAHRAKRKIKNAMAYHSRRMNRLRDV